MFKNHIKIAFRFFKKNKLFTFINILGLAIGITAFLLLTQYVGFEKSYDENTDDIYRVTLSSNLGSDAFGTSATNHPAVGPAMEADFPEVENFARLVDSKIMNTRGILSYQKAPGELVKSNSNDYKIFFGEGAIFKMFNLPFIEGNSETALTEPGSIILSQSVAHRFFGDENPIGKEIKINSDGGLKVTGVFKDLPQNTHLEFDMLISLSSLSFDFETIWVWPEFYNYVELKHDIDSKVIDNKFPEFTQKYLSTIMSEYGFEAKFELQPVKDIHLKSDLSKEISSNSSERVLYFLIIIAAFVIGIALINFINLSTAKSMERAKEVGLKKVVGANRNILIWQFLIESLLINLIAIVVAILLISLLIKPFNALIGIDVLSIGMWSQSQVWLILFILFIVGGLLAGIYPAFILSSFKPIQVLKGKFYQSSKGTVLRKALVVAQFVIAIALVSGTFIVYNQFTFMQNQELGFQADQNLVINAPMDVDYDTAIQKIELFKKELERNPNILSMTLSTDIPGKPLKMEDGIRLKGDEKSNAIPLKFTAVDYDFLHTYKINLLAGRDFTEADESQYYPYDENGDATLHPVIINKSIAKSLGFSEPIDAINKQVVFKYGPAERTAEVIGVIDNYHQQSLQKGLDNIMLFYTDSYIETFLTINVTGNNINQTISNIETEYENLFPRNPFTYFFLDEYFNRQYQADQKIGTIFLLFSIFAIFIAALGLFGLGSHIAMQKVKEISVRKVLGASTLQALILIPKKLLGLVLISGVIAIPIVYLLTKNWLENYAFKVNIGLWMFLLPIVLVLLVAFFSILIQSLKSALINPADSLRNE